MVRNKLLIIRRTPTLISLTIDAYESSLKAAVEDDSLVEEYIELQKKPKFVQQKVVRIVNVKDKNKLQSLPGFCVDVIGDNVRLSYPVMIPSDYHHGKELSIKDSTSCEMVRGNRMYHR